MHITPLTWLLTILVIAVLLIFDYVFHVRKAHVPTLKEAAIWSAIYIGFALIFGVFVLFFWRGADPTNEFRYGMEYFSGYATEKALSVDNLFVFLIIMTSFAVPPKDQQKALMWGIILALIFRLIFIVIGAAALNQWAWLFYIFSIFLAYTAIKQVVDHRKERKEKLAGTYEDPDMSNNKVVRIARKILPITDSYHKDDIRVKINGKRFFTPMLLVIMSLGTIDLMFALDSIPAIYGLTDEAYIVFTTNAFSLMGLRQLYFLIDGLLERLVFLSYGLAAILGFIAIKLWLHAMHVAGIPFVSDAGFNVPEISTNFSLVYILSVLALTVIASILFGKRHPDDPIIQEARYKYEHRHDHDNDDVF
ncbi:MAG: TerC family protein [Coriobacteriia bacterium]|nr:TerC family protein [Coriobacteriia bacterium]